MKIGIDFGTTNTFIVHVVGDIPPTNYLHEPSAFNYDGSEEYFGNDAIDGDINFMKNAVFSVKKELLENTNQNHLIEGKNFSSEYISKAFLKKMIDNYKGVNLNQPVESAVIGVPVRAKEKYRATLIRLVNEIGINNVELIDEPVAAGVCFMNTPNFREDYKTIVVYDFGGGTFDVSLIQRNDGRYGPPFKVLDHDGALIGGDDCDKALADFVKGKARQKGLSVSEARHNVAKFKRDVRTAKEWLSTHPSRPTYTMRFEDQEDRSQSVEITRNEFNQVIGGLIDQTVELTNKLVRKAQVPIDCIVLTGGSSNLPLVQEKLAPRMAEAHITVLRMERTESGVAGGCAYRANNELVLSLSPYTYGVKLINGTTSNLIMRNKEVPVSVENEFITHERSAFVAIEVMESDSDARFVNNTDANQVMVVILKFREEVEAGHPVKVRYTLDSSGVLKIEGKDNFGHWCTDDVRIERV